MMVKIILDSISPNNIRLTTFHCRYWRAIHSELMTHRDFSRNARSSRAVPSLTLLTEDIFVPQFGMNKRGMQSEILASPELQDRWASQWTELAEICRSFVQNWQDEGMHKQWANRPLEWFGWIDVLITSVRWENFWALRISEYAQPEFNALAVAMKAEMELSKPQLLYPGDWHLPYISPAEHEDPRFGIELLRKLSVARCARLSYTPFDGEANLDAELKRYNSLVVSRPVHASPAEHQATPDTGVRAPFATSAMKWNNPQLHGNLTGWRQYRKMLPHEVVRENRF